MDIENKPLIYRHLVKLVNSVIYVFTRRPLYIKAWVDIRRGKPVPNNWGDDINIYLLELISNRKVAVCNCSFLTKFITSPNYICIGSVLGWYENKRSEIWGSGFISADSKLRVAPAKIHSVRGKLTRQKLLEQGIDCPESYGDPALLMSRYYTPDVQKRYRIGVVPHFVDYENEIVNAFIDRNPDCIKIQLKGYERWEKVVDQICSCDLILSSSLHGLIVADSYGIPNLWIRLSDKVYGNGFKFLDYFSSVDRDDKSPNVITSYNDIESIKGKADTIKYSAKIDFDSILSSCPFINQDVRACSRSSDR